MFNLGPCGRYVWGSSPSPCIWATQPITDDLYRQTISTDQEKSSAFSRQFPHLVSITLSPSQSDGCVGGTQQALPLQTQEVWKLPRSSWCLTAVWQESFILVSYLWIWNEKCNLATLTSVLETLRSVSYNSSKSSKYYLGVTNKCSINNIPG